MTHAGAFVTAAQAVMGAVPMSNIFGPMRQVGFVVRDIRAAMRHWVGCGVGPWFFAPSLDYSSFFYKGVPGRLKLSVALANSGDMQLELMTPLDDSPSMFRDFLDAGHEGMHHWCVWPDDYDDRLARALSSGWTIGQGGDSTRGKWAYLESSGHPGTIIELAEPTPDRRRINAGVAAAAREWDGSDPIRETWP